jgi:hypothetical protein
MNSKNKITLSATIAGILTFSILGMASLSINQASAQMADCQPTLSLDSSPRTGTVSTSGFLQVNLFGELICGDSGIGGATVIISGIDQGTRDVITDEIGKYSSQARLGPGEYELQAYFAGDATHISASATMTLQVNELSQDKFR